MREEALTQHHLAVYCDPMTGQHPFVKCASTDLQAWKHYHKVNTYVQVSM